MQIIIIQEVTTLNLWLNIFNEICILGGDFPGSRRPIPVSIIDQNSSLTYLAPVSGLDFLIDVNQLIIQQSVELADCKKSFSTY